MGDSTTEAPKPGPSRRAPIDRPPSAANIKAFRALANIPAMSTRRIVISFMVQTIAVIGLVRHFHAQGTFRALGAYINAANPWVEQCGLSPHKEFVLLSDRVLKPHGAYPGYVHVKGGLIHAAVTGSASADRRAVARALLSTLPGVPVLDFGDAVVGPGLVDVHVHMNEPGREEWEGVASGTRAAAAGGITTLVDMPLNSAPCTTTPAQLRAKLRAFQGSAHVDVGAWAGLVPGNARSPRTLRALGSAGALGFKAFMCPSGIDDFPAVSAEDIRAALPTLRKLGLPLLVHAELVPEGAPPAEGDPRSHATWVASRPESYEREAVRGLIRLLREGKSTRHTGPGFRVHVVHLSDALLLHDIAAAKKEGLPISVETCPHYLTFAAEDVPDGDTRFKCAPPLRGKANQEALWAGLAAGGFDLLSTDHSPSRPDLKLLEQGDFVGAWGGIAGLQYALPATWTGMEARGLNLTQLASLWSWEPARLAGLAWRKGALLTGRDADIAVWAPDEPADTSAEGLRHRHKVTPYQGRELIGRVLATFVRGQQVFDAAAGTAGQACGQALRTPRHLPPHSGGGRRRKPRPQAAGAARQPAAAARQAAERREEL